MCEKHLRLLAVVVAAIVMTLLMSASAMGWHKWSSPVDPGKNEPPAAPWVALPAAPVMAVGQSMWIAVDNLYIPTRTKNWWVEVVVPAGGATFDFSDWHGYYNNNGVKESVTNPVSFEIVPGPPLRLRANFQSVPQPDWEVVKITRTAKEGLADDVQVTIDGDSKCKLTAQEVSHLNVSFDSLRFGAPYDTIRLTEIWVFHASSQMNMAVAPTISAPPGSGTWSYQFVNVDPEGNPCPQGAVRWSTNGNGIESQQDSKIAFTMADQPYGLYTLYVYDAASGEYKRFLIQVTAPIPTFTEWGIIIFIVLLAGWMAFVVVRRWKASHAAA